MSIRPRFDVDQVLQALENLTDPDKIKRALGSLGRVLETRIKLGFARGQAPSGARWEPLKLRMGVPLVDTGRLRASIGYRVEQDQVVVGTNVLYARLHQFGGVIEPKNAKRLGPVPVGGSLAGEGAAGFLFLKRAVIPARPFMPLDASGQVDLPASWATASLNALGRVLIDEATP